MEKDIVRKVAEKPLILGVSIGNCVHVAGVVNFLRIAERNGMETSFLGAAVPVERIVKEVKNKKPDVLGVSYRLNPENGKRLIDQLLKQLPEENRPVLIFGCTPALAAYARTVGRFAFVFSGDEVPAVIENVVNQILGNNPEGFKAIQLNSRTSLIGKDSKIILPIIRHHFGLPRLDDTISGVRKIADAGVLDVISIAPDQNAQQFFFRPHFMKKELGGAGGVPIRKPDDLRKIWEAAQTGNCPRLRIYSGTYDMLKWAEMSLKEMDNAWGAVPLFWYSELDGRSERNLKDAIIENQKVIKWYAEHQRPVEVLEAHQWSLREAPDSVAVAMAYIAAYNARHFGVRDYYAQYMFNTPVYTSTIHDIAKMVAKLALIETLRTENFIPYRQVRSGLSHFSSNMNIAKGQLAASVTNMLGLRPNIIHVVAFTEGDHSATANEVIESCQIVSGVLKNSIGGIPDPLKDERVEAKCKKLIEEARWLLGTIYNIGKQMGSKEPFVDPEVLSIAVRIGVLDAPHLKGHSIARGNINTIPCNGGCVTTSGDTANIVSEYDRLINTLDMRREMLGDGVVSSELVQQLQIMTNIADVRSRLFLNGYSE